MNINIYYNLKIYFSLYEVNEFDVVIVFKEFI